MSNNNFFFLLWTSHVFRGHQGSCQKSIWNRDEQLEMSIVDCAICTLYSTQCNWNKHELEASHEIMRRGIRHLLEFLLVGLMLLCNYLAAVSGSGHRDICRTQHPLFQTTFYKIEDCIAGNVQIIFQTTFQKVVHETNVQLKNTANLNSREVTKMSS